MPVPVGPTEEEDKGEEGGADGGPEAQGPLSLILKVKEEGVGEERAQVEGLAEVAKEGDLGMGILSVILPKWCVP